MSTPVSVPSFTLNNERKFPAIGLGTWQAVGDEMVELVKTAIDVGYRMIDTASFYKNEKEVGEGVRAKITEGIIKREDVFITSKVWVTDHALSQIIPACKQSLQRFGFDYIDLYLVHWPFAFKDEAFEIKDESVTIEEKWSKMEDIVELGLAKSIGLSNFNSEQIERILKVAKIKPVVNQVECHPYMNQKKLIKYCEERNIIITAYAPLGSPNWPDNPFTNKIPILFDNEIVKEISIKHKKTSAQVVLRYLYQLGVVSIPKTSNENRLTENINIFDFNLDANDMLAMDSLNNNLRSFTFNPAKLHRDYPFNIEF